MEGTRRAHLPRFLRSGSVLHRCFNFTGWDPRVVAARRDSAGGGDGGGMREPSAALHASQCRPGPRPFSYQQPPPLTHIPSPAFPFTKNVQLSSVQLNQDPFCHKAMKAYHKIFQAGRCGDLCLQSLHSGGWGNRCEFKASLNYRENLRLAWSV